MFKKLLFTTAALAIIATPGFAADMPLKAVKAPPPVPVFNWTGFYIGGFVGGAWTDHAESASDPRSAAGVFYNGPLNTGYGLQSGFLGGGTVGYNWQAPGSPWVIGLEGEGGYLHVRGSAQDINAALTGLALPDSINTSRIGDAYGVIAGRVGYAWDRALFYAKGGVAFVGDSYNFNDSCTTGGCGSGALFMGHNDTQVTYAVGGGMEYALDFNWSIKAEYLFLGTQKTYTQSGLVTAGGATGTLFTNTNSDPNIQTFKFGVNYRWGGPIMAKY